MLPIVSVGLWLRQYLHETTFFRLRNCSTLQIENLLRREFSAIKLFYEDENLSLLALS